MDNDEEFVSEEETSLLDNAIEDAFEQLERFPVGTEERKAAAEEVVALYKQWNDEKRIEVEEREHNLDGCLRQAEIENQIEDRRKDRIINIALKVGGGIAMAGFYTFLFFGGLIFEEKGSVRSNFVRGFSNTMSRWLPFFGSKK